MAPPFLNANLCGLDLRTGSLVIGYIYLVADLVMCTVVVAGAAFLEAAKQTLDEAQQHRLPVIPNTEGIMLCLWLLMLPLITMLLVGLHTNRAYYVRIFLLGVFAYIILETAMFFVGVVFHINGYIMAAHLIVLMVEVYFFIIVRTHYYSMIQGNVQGNLQGN